MRLAAVSVCFFLLLALAILPAIQSARDRVSARLGKDWRRLAVAGIWAAPYLIYAIGTHDFRWPAFLRLLALCVPPLALYVFLPVSEIAKLAWQDVIAWLWLSLAILFHQTSGIWMAPRNLDFMARLWLIVVCSWCWVFIRPVPQLGYRLSLSPGTVRPALINFVLFAAIAIPSSFALGFARWNPQWHGLGRFGLEYVEIFVFIAWLEELLFRGFLQTLLSQRVNSPVRGQAMTSVIFGLSHILHAPVPNWRYVLLATIAGWFYGRAFRQGGWLTASAMKHALVDTVWRTFFWRG